MAGTTDHLFVCWEWQDNLNIIIEKWNNIGLLKTPDSNGPSLLMVVEHFIEESNKKMTAAGQKDVFKMIEQPEKKLRISEKWEEEKQEEEVSKSTPEGTVAKNIDDPESSNRTPEKLDEAAKDHNMRVTNLKEENAKTRDYYGCSKSSCEENWMMLRKTNLIHQRKH